MASIVRWQNYVRTKLIPPMVYIKKNITKKLGNLSPLTYLCEAFIHIQGVCL